MTKLSSFILALAVIAAAGCGPDAGSTDAHTTEARTPHAYSTDANATNARWSGANTSDADPTDPVSMDASTRDARAGAGGRDDSPREIQAPLDVPSGNSLYALTADWVDQDGQNVRLLNLQGRPVMMSMVYTNCHFACPIIVHDMKRINREMPADLAKKVHHVLISLDPERDDPDALARFARAYGLDADRWTLLQGDQGDVRMLAAALGVKYKKEADGQYSHTNLVAVLDEQGEILHREINPGGASTSILAALQRGRVESAL